MCVLKFLRIFLSIDIVNIKQNRNSNNEFNKFFIINKNKYQKWNKKKIKSSIQTPKKSKTLKKLITIIDEFFCV